MASISPLRRRMIEDGARMVQTVGLNRLLGQIHMLLCMSAAPRSLGEIGDELEMSKASVSIACRQLAGLGILKRARKKGDRLRRIQTNTYPQIAQIARIEPRTSAKSAQSVDSSYFGMA